MPAPRYLTWNEKWLIAEDIINCSECWAAQFMMQRDKDFEHASICPRAGPGQRPYMELLDMLKAIQDDLPES